MDKAVQILVVGSDPALPAEFQEAAAGVANRHVLVHWVRDPGQAEEAVRSRRPQLICVDLTDNPRPLALLARQIVSAEPDAAVIAMYRPERMTGTELETSFVIESLRSGIRDFLRRPLSSTELRQLMDRFLALRRSGIPQAGAILSFISNKGGVGKSTLSVNTACMLAEKYPGEVLLVDASLQLGICALMLDLLPTTTIVDAVRERGRLDETLLRRFTEQHESGLHLLAAPKDVAEASEIDTEAMSHILNLARRTFRYIVVDTFPVLDSTVLTILDLTDRAYIVFQGTAPTVVGVARLLPLLTTLGFPADRQRVILNHNYKSFSGDLTAIDIESRLGRQIDYIVPYKKNVLVSMNTGRPTVLSGSRRFGFGLAIAELAEDLDDLEIQTEEIAQATTA
jgi:pilus assembly protein CpaE